MNVRTGRTDRPGIIATGSMVITAVEIARVLDLAVWSAPVLKPLRADHICAAARLTSGLITLEEHSVFGGLGAAVAEITGEHEPVRLLRIGVPDRFSEYCGTYSYLLREHGLDTESVRERILAFCQSTAPRIPPGAQ
jgi:transketolase